MSDMLVGIFALILGLAIAFTGHYLWSVMLPIWGFVVGFFIGVAGAGLAMTPSSNAMLYAVVATGRSLPRRLFEPRTRATVTWSTHRVDVTPATLGVSLS
jgi:hypothetical protein